MTKQLPADIAAFKEKHLACEEIQQWPFDDCTSMQDVWDKAPSSRLIWVATRHGVLDDRTLRLFACWCVRRVRDHLGFQLDDIIKDGRSNQAVEVAERFANGKATEDELKAAWAAAWDASHYFTRRTYFPFSRDFTRAAAQTAVRAAVRAAQDASHYSDLVAGWNAYIDFTNDQAQWLRENASPNFT